MRHYTECTSRGPARCRGVLPAVLTAVWVLFPLQDSNPFASLVFYWEPLNRQVSERAQDSLGRARWEFIYEPSGGPLSDSSQTASGLAGARSGEASDKEDRGEWACGLGGAMALTPGSQGRP